MLHLLYATSATDARVDRRPLVVEIVWIKDRLEDVLELLGRGWREVIRELPREQKEMASHFTVDELPAREAAAFGNISKQIITHINRTADAEAIDLLALLPELLLTDRALTRNGTRRFLERCHQVVALRGLDDLLQRPDGRFRRRLASANDDERVQTDVLKLIRKMEYGRAGKALMRNEVARGTSSTLEALERLFPDKSEELRELQANLEGEDLPEGVPLDREIFMHLIGADETGRVKQGSAADATGWRWEHLAWIVTAGGADELYELCNKLWLGTIEMNWVHAGRIVALRKPKDAPNQDDPNLVNQRCLRPVGLVSIFMRLIGSVAAKQFQHIFKGIFDPHDFDDEWSPVNAGVGCRGGVQQVQHSVTELLTLNPSYGVLLIDAEAAFQNCKRPIFLRRIKTLAPGLYRWTRICYGRSYPRYVRMESGDIDTIWATTGTTQGDPLGPADHNFTTDELMKELAREIKAAQLYFLDDGTIVGPVEELARFADALTDPDGSAHFETRTGMRLNISKCVLWTLGTAFPADDESVWARDRDILEEMHGVPANMREELNAETQRRMALEERARLREIFPTRVHEMRGLREPRGFVGDTEFTEDALESQGLVILGSPIVGTSRFVEAKLDDTLNQTREYIQKAQSVLLPNAATSNLPSDKHFPDEYLALMRTTLPGRFQHHCTAVTHPIIATKVAEFDEIQLAAYSYVVGALHSPDVDAEMVVQLGSAWGGRGYHSMSRHRGSLLLGAWAMSHAQIRRRLGLVCLRTFEGDA